LDLVDAALASGSFTAANGACCDHGDDGGSVGSICSEAELSTIACNSFRFLLSATHIGIIGPDAVQFAMAREGAAWTTLLARCLSACFVGDRMLLLLCKRRHEGVDHADAVDGGEVHEQNERPPTVTLVRVELDDDGSRTEHATTDLSALGTRAWRLLPASCDQLRAHESSDATLRGTFPRDQFVLLTATVGGGGVCEAWLGETAAGSTPVVLSQRPLRIVCAPGVGPCGAGAHSFRLLTTQDELQPVVELVAF
jgi:hypothetical protein